MAQSALYDEDILLWSEQQAEVIRRLARTRRDLPNELDVENVAEEIESLARSDRREIRNRLAVICIANLANHRSLRLFSDALPVTRCFA